MNTFEQVKGITNFQAITIPAICPGCNREGNLSPIGQDLQLQLGANLTQAKYIVVGSRMCPNAACGTHLFVAYQSGGPPRPEGPLICSYPVGRIDFNTDDIPDKVRRTFDEALTCAANECYVGAGMLIRKTLEAVCEDLAATGGSLKARIADLKTRVTLPTALFDAMDHLRLLGNDAAHIEAKDYDEIGKPEVTAGVELTKEIIKATYQHKGLLAKLLGLKK